MLIYLIIALELALLYIGFWYVYIREPKRYRITGNPWGKYGHGYQSGGADPTLPFVVEAEELEDQLECQSEPMVQRVFIMVKRSLHSLNQRSRQRSR